MHAWDYMQNLILCNAQVCAIQTAFRTIKPLQKSENEQTYNLKNAIVIDNGQNNYWNMGNSLKHDTLPWGQNG